MDELIALALVAAIAIGKYQEAGVIAFFVLIENLIETRTALGARASIESLIRLRFGQNPQARTPPPPTRYTQRRSAEAEARISTPAGVPRLSPRVSQEAVR